MIRHGSTAVLVNLYHQQRQRTSSWLMYISVQLNRTVSSLTDGYGVTLDESGMM